MVDKLLGVMSLILPVALPQCATLGHTYMGLSPFRVSARGPQASQTPAMGLVNLASNLLAHLRNDLWTLTIFVFAGGAASPIPYRGIG